MSGLPNMYTQGTRATGQKVNISGRQTMSGHVTTM